MIVTEVVPGSLSTMDVAASGAEPDAGRAWLTSIYHRPEKSYVRLNMITSLTGSASGSDGTSETLTSPVDRAILGTIRGDADVVLVGAQTVRQEGYVIPRATRLAIVTTTGDLQGHRLDAEGSGRVFLLCPAEHAARVRVNAEALGATVIVIDHRAGDAADHTLDPGDILSALAAHDMRRVVVEGGPSLAGQFAAAGAIDEYCVSVAPVIEPADAPFIAVTAASTPATKVAGMLVDAAGFSYLRLRALPSGLSGQPEDA